MIPKAIEELEELEILAKRCKGLLELDFSRWAMSCIVGSSAIAAILMEDDGRHF